MPLVEEGVDPVDNLQLNSWEFAFEITFDSNMVLSRDFPGDERQFETMWRKIEKVRKNKLRSGEKMKSKVMSRVRLKVRPKADFKVNFNAKSNMSLKVNLKRSRSCRYEKPSSAGESMEESVAQTPVEKSDSRLESLSGQRFK